MIPASFPKPPAEWSARDFSHPSCAREGIELFGMRWERPEGHRAVWVIHGLGEHGGRYAHLPYYLGADRAIRSIVCVDHQGHGRSGGRKGHAEDFMELARDQTSALEAERARRPEDEVHVIAHSMGGLVALLMLLEKPGLKLASLTLSAPFLAPKIRVPLVKKLAARGLSSVLGSIQLPTGIDADGICSDPEVVACYRADRLVHDRMTPRFYTTMEDARKRASAIEGGICPPALFVLPGRDPIVDSDVGMAFAKRLDQAEKRIQCYPNFLHESLNEIGKEDVFARILEWIAQSSLRLAS